MTELEEYFQYSIPSLLKRDKNIASTYEFIFTSLLDFLGFLLLEAGK